MDVFFLLLSIVVIVKGSDMLVDGCVNLAKFLRVPTLVIGLTVVAIATGVPEIAISITSSIKGSNGLLLGNLLGSNMFNILFILGLIALIKPLLVKREIIIKNYLFALLSCFVNFLLTIEYYFKYVFIILYSNEHIAVIFAGCLSYTFAAKPVFKPIAARDRQPVDKLNTFFRVIIFSTNINFSEFFPNDKA